MLMFPEGTTTNGQALIKFKPGAFLAGVPVQPVLLHYPGEPDTVRWTWKGLTWLGTLWHTTSQIYTSVTVEFLPVYTPSQEEKQNPDLYAENVQKLMANLTDAHVETVMNDVLDSCPSGQSTTVTADHLTTLLGLKDRRTAVKICSLYSKDDTVDLRQVCLSVSAVSGFRSLESLIHTAFTWYDTDQDGLLSAGDLSGLMGALVGVPQYEVAEMYTALTTRGRPTEASLQDLLKTHPVYGKVLSEYLHSSRLADGNHNGIPNGKTNGNNNGIYNGHGASSRTSD
ncbi:hypothetical protein cypCar_00037235 [Cyprinus carpio]|nr:hypothetical protein cypCar_00037235 [Cyprinus carpio]